MRWSIALRALAVPAAAVALTTTATGAVAGTGDGPGGGTGDGPGAGSGRTGAVRLDDIPRGGTVRLPRRVSDTSCDRGRKSAQTCDGTDPIRSRCDSGAYTVASSRLWYHDGRGRATRPAGATVELRYSPRCGTNWSRVILDQGRTGPVGVLVCWGAGVGDCTEMYATRGRTAYSDQLYAKDVEATAYGLCCGTWPDIAAAWGRG
ncbi:DUF2690 domain-containing protein [Microbispora hainanensis]|uniref:DUF2690 domain-containing protein n=1 Tax=Microbispora hainanensis TaxID=568844 RepID=A0A544YYB4_9ACTN|nr:DUF2690 domain-containing protein [Microbispora hainanensis]TQS21512.1 DUF2690 domain-containing protein [Microbispora hainanensis]